jgi:hypothetical protein
MVLRAAPLAPAKGAGGATRSFLTSPWAACDQNFWTPIVVMSHAGRSFAYTNRCGANQLLSSSGTHWLRQVLQAAGRA